MTKTVLGVLINIELISRWLFYDDSTMKEVQAVTSLALSPERERNSRMVKYSIAMGLRLVCIGACFLVSGWWLLLPAFGAVILPYFAVVVANSVTRAPSGGAPLRPGSLGVYSPE